MRLTQITNRIGITKRINPVTMRIKEIEQRKKGLQIKRYLALIFVCAGFCTACGNAGTVEPVMGTTAAVQKETESVSNNSTETVTTAQNEEKSEVTTQTETKSMQEIYEEIAENVEQPEMVTLNDNYIANYYGIDLSLLEDYLFASAEDVIYADTIVLIKVKEESSAQTMKDVLDTMITQKKLELENYLPEQFQIVEKSEVVVTGSYVYLVISENAEEIQRVIAQYLN